MKIKTLNLYAFGKFENTTIELADGFNLIFGPNEAGKSTIQAFIEGMFFGFYKPYRKRRTYSEDFARYRPMHSDKYYGAMVIVDDSDREIRIERDFLQERDGVRIYDNLTGEDITTHYPYDAATKQYLPLGYDSINASIYNNTVNFKQMATYSDEALAQEVNNRLIDLASQNGSEVSVSGVIDYLEEKKREIGTFRRSRSNYGLAVRKREQLEEQLAAAETNDRRIRNNQKRILAYQKTLARYEKRKADHSAERKNAERAAVDAQNRRVDAAREEGEKLKAQQAALREKSAAYDAQTYDHLRYLNRSGETLERQKKALAEQIHEVDRMQNKTQREWDKLNDKLSDYDARQVDADWRLYQRAVGENTKDTGHVSDADLPKKRANQSRLLQTLLSYGRPTYLIVLAIGLALLIVGFVNPADYFVFAAQVVLLAAGLFLTVCGVCGNVLISHKATDVINATDDDAQIETGAADRDFAADVDDLLNDDEDDDAVLSQEDEALAQAHQEAEETVAELLYLYDVADEAAFKREITRIQRGFATLKDLTQTLSDDEVKMNSLKRQQADMDRQMTDIALEIKNILEPLGMTSIEAYAEGAKAQDALKDIDAKIAANKTLVENMAGADYAKMPSSGRIIQRSEADKNERAIDQSIKSISHEIAALEGTNQTLSAGRESAVSLREKIATLTRQIDAYEAEIKALDMAEAFFKRDQKRSHRLQAGDLNEKIGEILGEITHRYHEVRVDDKLNVKVVSPSTGALISMDQLSGGTIDQIYFALRFGVRDLLDTRQSLPFILDDPFVQYDDTRKKAALNFLNQMSQTDQIILFTCSGSEKQIMDEEGIHYIGAALI